MRAIGVICLLHIRIVVDRDFGFVERFAREALCKGDY